MHAAGRAALWHGFFFSFTAFFECFAQRRGHSLFFENFLKKLSKTEKENTKPEKSGSSSALFLRLVSIISQRIYIY
jgi:hypothetical protein